MMRLILIRHGKTEWNTTGRFQGQSDVKLSDEGRREAELLAENFPEKPDAIYSSDLSRAYTTALTVAEKFSLPVIKEPAFREISFGTWEGLTYDEIAAKWPDESKNLFTATDILKIPSGESFQDVARRATARITELRTAHEGETAAIFAHGAINKTIIASLLHIPLKNLWAVRQDNTAVNIFRFDGEYVSAELINGTSHLRRGC